MIIVPPWNTFEHMFMRNPSPQNLVIYFSKAFGNVLNTMLCHKQDL